MMLKNLKKLLLVNIFIGFSLQSFPTHQEIIDELTTFRKNTPQLKDNFNYSAGYYLDRVEEAKVLEKTTGWMDYAKKYATLCYPVSIMRIFLWLDLVMISQENTPKTYELIEHVAQKMGFVEMPILYLVGNENFFNAFASGLLQTMSIVALGEKMVKETTDLESLEFLIAHELAHIRNYHVAKKIIFGIFAITLLDQCDQFIIPHLIHDNKNVSIYDNIQKSGNNMQAYNIIKQITKFLLQLWYSRACEKDADITAAQCVGPQGGINLCKLFKEKMESHVDRDYAILQEAVQNSSLKDSKLFQARIACSKAFSKTVEFAGNLVNGAPFGTHPTNNQRIAYLEELLKEQEATLVVPTA